MTLVLLSVLCQRGNWDSDWSSISPKITQPKRAGPRLESRECVTKICFLNKPYLGKERNRTGKSKKVKIICTERSKELPDGEKPASASRGKKEGPEWDEFWSEIPGWGARALTWELPGRADLGKMDGMYLLDTLLCYMLCFSSYECFKTKIKI